MQKYRYNIIIAIFVIAIIALALMGPIPQDPAYHNFADQRSFYGIPNFWDVMSNLSIFVAGVFGITMSLKNISKREGVVAKLIPVTLSFGILFASFGSAYYHWAPDNSTLVWDRLPMTLMFMPIFALIIYDFIGEREGQWSFWILVPFGILSVVYWHFTEQAGNGDLRPYALVQFFPMVIAPFILWLFPKKVDYIKYVIYLLAWYVFAKISEYYDPEIYNLTGFWSGHTIKHLLSAVSLYYVVKLIVAWERQFVSRQGA